MIQDKTYIAEFIETMKSRYPRYAFGFFLDEENEWVIWHTNENEVNDRDFLEYSGELMYDILWEREIYNVDFCYDRHKAQIMTKRYNVADWKSWSVSLKEMCQISEKPSVDWSAILNKTVFAEKINSVVVTNTCLSPELDRLLANDRQEFALAS